MIRMANTDVDQNVLSAAVCKSGRLGNVEAEFDEQTLEAADRQFPHGIGLGQLIATAAVANGYDGNIYDTPNANMLRAAFQGTIQASGYSTVSISTILNDTANKFLRQGWDAVDMTPMRIAAVRSVPDFKQHTSLSLTGDLMFEQLGPGGELKHGTLGEETYTNQVHTYAKMISLTRQDIVNDDLGALTGRSRLLGRGAALKLNDIFWTEFLDNSSFFTSGRANVSTDTGELGLVGLQQAETVFMNQNDPNGFPQMIEPAILLVPTDLKSTALQLMTSEKIKGDADEPEGNVWRGRFRVESSPYMSNSNYTGNSTSAWYLLADPNVLPVIEIAALNGRVEPVVESADADFNTLGVQMRGYSDVGVNKQEYRAGVRADGSAAE